VVTPWRLQPTLRKNSEFCVTVAFVIPGLLAYRPSRNKAVFICMLVYNVVGINPCQCSGKFVAPENYSHTQQYGLGLRLRIGSRLGLGLRLRLRLGQGLPSPLKDGDIPQLTGATRPRRRRRRGGWGMGRGFSPPQPIRGARKRRELPQRGPGRSPGRKTNFMHFKLHNALFWWIDNLIFTTLWSVKIFKK